MLLPSVSQPTRFTYPHKKDEASVKRDYPLHLADGRGNPSTCSHHQGHADPLGDAGSLKFPFGPFLCLPLHLDSFPHTHGSPTPVSHSLTHQHSWVCSPASEPKKISQWWAAWPFLFIPQHPECFLSYSKSSLKGDLITACQFIQQEKAKCQEFYKRNALV